MKLQLLSFLLVFYTLSTSSNAQRVPAEWEPQHATIFTWFEGDLSTRYSVDSVHLKMVKSLTEANNKLIINVKNNSHKKHIISILSTNQLPVDNIIFRKATFNFPLGNYPRDYGPEWRYDTLNQLSVIDLNWAFYGYLYGDSFLKRYLNNPLKSYDKQIANELGIKTSATSKIISEGGAKEFNGAGVLMLVEQTELKRNPGYSKETLDSAYKKLFKLEKIIWLPYPTYDDEHIFNDLLEDENRNRVVLRSASANGHIDEFCRFLNSNTILLAEITEEEALKSDLHRINKDRLDATYNILKNETDVNGNPYKIIRIPVPDPQFYKASENPKLVNQLTTLKKLFKANTLLDGSGYPKVSDLKFLPALSYCNFTIANGVVLIASYWEEGLPESIKEKDKRAYQVIQQAFPDRKIIAINPLAINFGGGGLHCNTRHIPEKKLQINELKK
ncbi:MAG: agmatine deiminase family protein [Flammeovirgaceae bacterium]|nr:agmatine deiminase family protein [Flammeovirgaceae bacterium]